MASAFLVVNRVNAFSSNLLHNNWGVFSLRFCLIIKLALFRARTKKEPVGFIYALSGPLHSKVFTARSIFSTFSSTISNQSLPKNAKNVIPKNQGLRDRTRGGARGALPFPALFVRNHKYRNRCIFTITTNFKNPSPHPQNWFVNHPSSPNGNYLSSYPYGPPCGHLPWHEFLF